MAGARACAGAGTAAGGGGAARPAPRAGRQPAGATERAQRLRFAVLAPDPGEPAPVAVWQAAIRAWLARLVAVGQGPPRDLG